ncbi:InlB B-repeat-containing protein [Dehalogenimonas formicexedens]|nr:InlB B-repeat-containing protein [Dehalogenimonas formicexedens]
MKNRPFHLASGFIKILFVTVLCLSFSIPAHLYADRQFTITPSAGTGGIITPPNPQNVPEGNSKSFTITANLGYHIAEVLVDGASVGAVVLYTFTNVTADHTIAASFSQDTPQTFTITASAGANGAIDPSGAVAVASGGSQVFNITAGAGFHVMDVLVDGGSIGPAVSYTFTDVIADHTIEASFAPDVTQNFTITASAGANGTIDPPGAITVVSGGSQTFNINPGTGFHVLDVLVDDISAGAVTSYTFTNLTANHTIAASFTADSYTLTYTAGPGGTVSGITSQMVNYGESGTPVAAVPGTGYHFVTWSDGILTDSRTDANVVADISVSASFAPDVAPKLTITPTAGAGGTINPSAAVTVTPGGSQVFAITADAGYYILDVLVDGVSIGAMASYIFTNVVADHTITASFAVNTYTLTYTADAHGTINGGSPQVVNFGGSGTPVTAAPDIGYHFICWSDGVLTASRTDANVTAEISVSASFAPDIHTVVFDSQGGSAISSQSVSYGGLVVLPTPPARDAHVFAGWYKEAACTSQWNFNTDIVTDNTTIYANWTASSGGGGDGGGFGSQVVGIGLAGTSPFMDGNGKVIAAGSVETSDGNLKLDIPVGVSIWNAAGAAQPFLTAAILSNPPPSLPQDTLVSAYEMGPNGVTFTPAISMIFHYTDDQVPPGSRESDLVIAWWNGSTWVELAGTVDTEAKTVTASVSHFTSFALFAPEPPKLPSPILAINTPSGGTSTAQGTVTVTASVGNLKLLTGERSNVPGEGRIIYYLDVSIPIIQGKSALTAPGTYAEGTSESYIWDNLAPGSHTLGIQLIQNDGTPFDPPVVSTISINVLAPSISTSAPEVPNLSIPGLSAAGSTGSFNPLLLSALLLPATVMMIFMLSRRAGTQPRRVVPVPIEPSAPVLRPKPVTIPEKIARQPIDAPVKIQNQPETSKQVEKPVLARVEELGEYIIRLHNTGSGALSAIRDYIQHTPEIKLLTLNNCYSDVQMCLNVSKDTALVSFLSRMLINCSVRREGRIILVNGKN